MPYVDYSYYISGYLTGRTPSVPEGEFLYWEGQAELEIDKRTFRRLKQAPELVDDSVKKCACAVLELLYKADKLSEQSYQAGHMGPLTSYSNDGVSGSFDLSQSEYAGAGKQKKIQEIIVTYLSHTGLLYAGMPCGGKGFV